MALVASLMVRLAFFGVGAGAGAGTETAVPFFVAHLAFCAAAILALVVALKVRFSGVVVVAGDDGADGAAAGTESF
ncbi:MAG: hypothetical protein RL514_4687 [Verrucomicrobiota bacterium]